jgi:hypothetical protein
VVLNRWTEATKTTATYPRLSSQQNNNDFRSSDFWTYKTDRSIGKVQLSYNFTGKELGKTFVRDLEYMFPGRPVHFLKAPEILNLTVAGTPQFSIILQGSEPDSKTLPQNDKQV